jgi:CxxC motif-containing protein
MLRKFTCIICPNGCEITAEYGAVEGEGVTVRSVEGQGCKRGAEYVRQELTDPRRTIASSVPVRGGELPLTSVRLTAPIPKTRIFDAMREIKKLSLDAPVEAGTILAPNLLGLDTDLVITKSVDRKRG